MDIKYTCLGEYKNISRTILYPEVLIYDKTMPCCTKTIKGHISQIMHKRNASVRCLFKVKI